MYENFKSETILFYFYFIYSLFNVDNTVKNTVYKLFSYRKLLIYVNHLSKKKEANAGNSNRQNVFREILRLQ